MICLTDIAQGLANTCRFGGQMQKFYSVAQHSILVTMLAPPELQKAALLHDAAEAYLGDIIKPLKNMISGYAEIETAFERVIFKKFGVDFDLLKEIKPYDMRALTIEYEAIHGEGLEFKKVFYNGTATPFWTPEKAVDIYVNMLNGLVLQNLFRGKSHKQS